MTLLAFLLALRAVPNDSDLTERLQRREPEAMGELYDRYGRLVYSLILRMVRDSGVAEDLVQETFLRVWNRVQCFDREKGALGPWLLAVARNRAIDYLRSIENRPVQADVDLGRLEHPSLFTNLERDILNAENARRLREAFGRLTENQRRAIELAYFEGLSQTEMAERMGQPLGTVKTWVRAALKTLREEMGVAAGV